jgi:hypothetical protein
LTNAPATAEKAISPHATASWNWSCCGVTIAPRPTSP